MRGSLQCAVTQENDKLDWIGDDKPIRNVEGTPSTGYAYARTFTLSANPKVDYFVGGFGSKEDGCDQAGIKISLCQESNDGKDDATRPDDTQVTDPDGDKTSSSDTPDSSKTGKDDTVSGSKDPVDSKDSSSTGNSTDSKSSTDGKKDKDSSGNTNSGDGSSHYLAQGSQANGASGAQDSGDVQGVTTNNGSAHSASPVQGNTSTTTGENSTPGASEGAASYGPKVNTGGEVSTSFFSKVVSLFR